MEEKTIEKDQRPGTFAFFGTDFDDDVDAYVPISEDGKEFEIYRQGLALKSQGKLDDALRCYEEALKMFNVSSYFMIGVC
jgi:tetratricopeptide (TPR) repeat protein